MLQQLSTLHRIVHASVGYRLLFLDAWNRAGSGNEQAILRIPCPGFRGHAGDGGPVGQSPDVGGFELGGIGRMPDGLVCYQRILGV